MEVVTDPSEFRRWCANARMSGRLGFVPTMGALHDGHLSLMRFAKQHCPSVVVSIFVNPTQFGPNEDLARYPRDLDRDLKLCRDVGVELVFAPDVSDMYLDNERTRVSVSQLAQGLCGAKRSGHFDGVCTVVAKFFSLVGECVAVFGRKDYQQLKIIERMARDLFLPVEVVGHPIVREADGLAMSSRNRYLDSLQRSQALSLSRGLARAAIAFDAGERDSLRLERLVAETVQAAGLVVEYASCVHADELTPFEASIDAPTALLAVAAFAGQTRLIDNCVLGEVSTLGPAAKGTQLDG